MAEFLPVKVDSIRVSLTTQQRVLILHEPTNDLYLPIWVGSFEAESIVIALQEIEVSRPQPHDLLKNTISALNGKLLHVVLSKIQEDTFYSYLVLDQNDTQVNVDSRPSDAISLAIRCKVPILVNLEVLQSAGIQPEKDLREATRKDELLREEDEETDLQKLSVFDDFLKKLDLSEPLSDENEPDSPSDKDDDDKNDDKGQRSEPGNLPLPL